MSLSIIKIVAAFVAGIVVALGSALVYIRVNDPGRYEAPVQALPAPPAALPNTQSPTAQPPTARPETSASEETKKPDEAGKAQTKKHEPAKPERVKQPEARQVLVAERKPAPPPEPIQIAQNTPVPSTAQPQSYPLPEQPSDESSRDQGPVQQMQPASVTPSPAQPPHVVTLPVGTNLFVRLQETLSTDHNYTGDAFRATVDVPVIMGGFIIVDKGSKVLGRIVNADKAGHFGGAGDLTLALAEIHTTDGQTVRIQTGTFDKKGPSNTGATAAKIGGGAAIGAIIGAIAGGGKGAAIGAGVGGAAGTGAAAVTHSRPAILQNEMRLTFQLSAPVTITEKLNNN